MGQTQTWQEATLVRPAQKPTVSTNITHQRLENQLWLRLRVKGRDWANTLSSHTHTHTGFHQLCRAVKGGERKGRGLLRHGVWTHRTPPSLPPPRTNLCCDLACRVKSSDVTKHLLQERNPPPHTHTHTRWRQYKLGNNLIFNTHWES